MESWKHDLESQNQITFWNHILENMISSGNWCFLQFLIMKRFVSIDIHQSKWNISSITTISMIEIIIFKTWFVAKYDSIKNNKNHEASYKLALWFSLFSDGIVFCPKITFWNHDLGSHFDHYSAILLKIRIQFNIFM